MILKPLKFSELHRMARELKKKATTKWCLIGNIHTEFVLRFNYYIIPNWIAKERVSFLLNGIFRSARVKWPHRSSLINVTAPETSEKNQQFCTISSSSSRKENCAIKIFLIINKYLWQKTVESQKYLP